MALIKKVPSLGSPVLFRVAVISPSRVTMMPQGWGWRATVTVSSKVPPSLGRALRAASKTVRSPSASSTLMVKTPSKVALSRAL